MFKNLGISLFSFILITLSFTSCAIIAPEIEVSSYESTGPDAHFTDRLYYQTIFSGNELCLDKEHATNLWIKNAINNSHPSCLAAVNSLDGEIEGPLFSEEIEGNKIISDVPIVINDRVEYFIRFFQTRGKVFFERWLARSTKYLPMVKDILRENGLPEDLAYLALIESGFNTKAYSRAKASGMWQFMKWTGKRYGLRIDWWIDERRDPEKATWAAAAYLKNLYNEFDSWHLAAAGYNGGEGRIRRALKKHKTDDFWVIAKKRKALKRETRNYIPKYMAAMLIAKEPEEYGFRDIKYYEPLEYDKIKIQKATDLRVIARACECSVQEIKELNPELRRWFTPPNYPGYEVKIPKGKATIFLANISMIPKQELLRFLKHRVKRGEALYTIARKYGTKIEPIVYLNNIKNARFIREGRLIVIPLRARDRGRKRAERVTVSKDGTYLVRTGDTLWDISLRFGVRVKDLLEWNKIDKPDRLFPGQRLYVKEARLDTGEGRDDIG
ncbi:MAG: LysM peptidoglycan-binding domain-containing protein [Thermodesulfobacteriota bacterium]